MSLKFKTTVPVFNEKKISWKTYKLMMMSFLKLQGIKSNKLNNIGKIEETDIKSENKLSNDEEDVLFYLLLQSFQDTRPALITNKNPEQKGSIAWKNVLDEYEKSDTYKIFEVLRKLRESKWTDGGNN